MHFFFIVWKKSANFARERCLRHKKFICLANTDLLVKTLKDKNYEYIGNRLQWSARE